MNNETFLTALKGLLAIESVALVDADETHPYGTGPARALTYVMELCRELGIRTENRDNKVAWAEIGQGDEIVAILGHLDTVPAGDGWAHDPKGEICGDRLYGRGAVDDKGPVLAALFAMKELQDSGVPLGRRVRLIFGQCEEVGDWGDMEYYKATQQLPAFGIRCDCTDDEAPVYMDKNGKVVQAMAEVYRGVTGDLSEPTVIGGGTYARAMPGIVAFGPMQPGRECTEHQKDEYILLDDLFAAKEIYRQTIDKLANLGREQNGEKSL